jgi:hypothetical protein
MFARGWEGALVLACDHVRQVLGGRAIDGVEEPVSRWTGNSRGPPVPSIGMTRGPSGTIGSRMPAPSWTDSTRRLLTIRHRPNTNRSSGPRTPALDLVNGVNF